jgi:hypothetical protein
MVVQDGSFLCRRHILIEWMDLHVHRLQPR